MLLEKPPHFRLFPAPPGTEFFQGQCRAIAAKLHDGRVIGKRVAEILPNRMAPEIQPRVRFFELIIRICKALRNIPRQAEKTVAVGSIDSTVSAGCAGTFHNPVLDDVTEFLGCFVDGVAEVAKGRQFLHNCHGLLPVADAQDALQADNAAHP